MRDFELPGRSMAYAQQGMAATSHPQATLAALDVLRAGGNAVDAAVAAVAVQCVVEPHMTGIGGDCFVLYAPASGGVVAMNGSGRAPAGLTVERLIGSGVTQIGATSPHAVTVPGRHRRLAAGAGKPRHARARRTAAPGDPLRGGGIPGHAEGGVRLAPPPIRLEGCQGARDYYLPGGKAPEEGRVLRFPALARTLLQIAEGGAKAFYEGETASRMVAALQSFGGVHTEADFAAASAEFVDPIHTGYRDAVVYECPPNGQGIVVLLMLNILERFDLKALGQDSAARLHLLAEAARLAFRDRDAALCDTGHAEMPLPACSTKATRARWRTDRPGARWATMPPRCWTPIPTPST